MLFLEVRSIRRSILNQQRQRVKWRFINSYWNRVAISRYAPRSAQSDQCRIWKLRLLVSVPVGVVTTTGPVVAPVGTTAVIKVSETIL